MTRQSLHSELLPYATTRNRVLLQGRGYGCVCVPRHEDVWGIEVELHAFLNSVVRLRCCSRSDRFSHWERGWMDPKQSREGKNIPCLCCESNWGILVCLHVFCVTV